MNGWTNFVHPPILRAHCILIVIIIKLKMIFESRVIEIMKQITISTQVGITNWMQKVGLSPLFRHCEASILQLAVFRRLACGYQWSQPMVNLLLSLS